jgi:hypothetical protein
MQSKPPSEDETPSGGSATGRTPDVARAVARPGTPDARVSQGARTLHSTATGRALERAAPPPPRVVRQPLAPGYIQSELMMGLYWVTDPHHVRDIVSCVSATTDDEGRVRVRCEQLVLEPGTPQIEAATPPTKAD